ncbi:MAG: septum formation protein Maf [Candidatus Latescibacteria bacterium]|nr:septum formation protein Maf [Candidatus Latescibacterota bacterium]
MSAPPPRLILASASPRRVQLLDQLQLNFEQVASPVAEIAVDAAAPQAGAVKTAAAKAAAVHQLLLQRTPETPLMVLGADTIVCLEGAVLGKPRDPADAEATLHSLSGRRHQVHTGLSLILPTGPALSACATTQVYMRPLSTAAITAYVDSGEPMDKAGSYGIQGLAAPFVDRIEGCYYNVVGLPLALLCSLLEEAGYPPALFRRGDRR